MNDKKNLWEERGMGADGWGPGIRVSGISWRRNRGRYRKQQNSLEPRQKSSWGNIRVRDEQHERTAPQSGAGGEHPGYRSVQEENRQMEAWHLVLLIGWNNCLLHVETSELHLIWAYYWVPSNMEKSRFSDMAGLGISVFHLFYHGKWMELMQWKGPEVLQ